MLGSSMSRETVPVHRRLKMSQKISVTTYKIKTLPSTSISNLNDNTLIGTGGLSINNTLH